MFYTKEQIQVLEKYRKTFETAIHSGFARNVGSIALKEIESIYDEAYGSHYSYNSGCSVCVLQFIKRVGEPFLKEAEAYKKKEEREKAAEEEEKKQQEQQEAEEEEKKALPPDVEMKDGTITFSFERAEAEEAAIKAKAEQTNTEVVENVEVKGESLVIETVNTNDTEPPKTNKRTRKKKEDGNTE